MPTGTAEPRQPHVDPAAVECARLASILFACDLIGIQDPPVEKAFASPFREDRHPSFSVSIKKNACFDHSAGKSWDPIALVMEGKRTDFAGAVGLLTGSTPAAGDRTVGPRPVTAQRASDASKPLRTLWRSVEKAEATFAGLTLARDDERARQEAERHGNAPDSLPDSWRIFNYPGVGPGIVHRGMDSNGQPAFAYRSFARDAKGKRSTRNLWGLPDGAELWPGNDTCAVVFGADKGLALHLAAGVSVLSVFGGERALAPAWATLLASKSFARFVACNDADAAGQKANAETTAALAEAGVSVERLALVEWPADAPKGFDVNDTLLASGADAVQELLANAAPWRPDVVPDAEPAPDAKDRLSVLSPSVILSLELSTSDNLLADRLLARGEALAMFGSGGLGKSLLTLNLAIDTILGRPWCGFETHGLKTRWLVFSPENGLRRDKRDLRGILRDTSQDERDLLDEYLRVHVPIEERDRYMNFSDPANVRRMMYEVHVFKPDVVVFDPLIEFFQGENENDSTQMRECYQMMMRIARAGLPDAAGVIAHHARAGKGAIRGALGFDAANFGRGSKALFSSVRGAINVAPTDEKDSNRLLLAPSKCNNGKLPDPVAVRRDPETLRHEIDHDFSWEDFEAQTAEKRAHGGAPKKCTTLHVVTSLQAAGGPGLSHTALVRAIQALAPCSEPTAKRAVTDAKEHGDIVLMNGVYSIARGGIKTI